MHEIPYTPVAVSEKYLERIPTSLVTAINELLVEKGYLLLTPKTKDKGIDIAVPAIIERTTRLDSSITEQILLDNDFFDLKNLYGQYGWDVSYHEPKPGEDCPAYYLFKMITE